MEKLPINWCRISAINSTVEGLIGIVLTSRILVEKTHSGAVFSVFFFLGISTFFFSHHMEPKRHVFYVAPSSFPHRPELPYAWPLAQRSMPGRFETSPPGTPRPTIKKWMEILSMLLLMCSFVPTVTSLKTYLFKAW